MIYQIIDAFRRISDVSLINHVFIAMQTCPKSLPNLVERIADFTVIPPVQVLLETPRHAVFSGSPAGKILPAAR